MVGMRYLRQRYYLLLTNASRGKLTPTVDALPPDLNIKLRANREDATLPDNHGQIWMELATLSSNSSKLFQDSNKMVEQQMLDYLGLSSRVKFPVRRLATLWKNNSWNPVITRWCQFPVGQATFTISTFEWMASCRIDDVSSSYIKAYLGFRLTVQIVLVRCVRASYRRRLGNPQPARL